MAGRLGKVCNLYFEILKILRCLKTSTTTCKIDFFWMHWIYLRAHPRRYLSFLHVQHWETLHATIFLCMRLIFQRYIVKNKLERLATASTDVLTYNIPFSRLATGCSTKLWLYRLHLTLKAVCWCCSVEGVLVQDFEDYVECFEYGPLFALGTTCSPQTLLELFARSTLRNVALDNIFHVCFLYC